MKFLDGFVKTVFDYTLTAVGTICISPLLAYIAYRIKKKIRDRCSLRTHALEKMASLFLASNSAAWWLTHRRCYKNICQRILLRARSGSVTLS